MMNTWTYMRTYFLGQPYAAEKALLMTVCVRHGGQQVTVASCQTLAAILGGIKGDPMKLGINVRRLILVWKNALVP